MRRPSVIRYGVMVVAMLVGLLGNAGASAANTGVLQIVVSGALALPLGFSTDGEIGLGLGLNLPVSLVSNGQVVPGTIGTATVAIWSDTKPTAGFGSPAVLVTFRVGGNILVVAGGIVTPSGFITTFSATNPVASLSGTWTATSAATAGIQGAGPGDALVTFTFDTNDHNSIFGDVKFVAQNLLGSILPKPIPGRATVNVIRDVPVLAVVGNAVDGRLGTLTSYSVANPVGAPSEFVSLTAINFNGVVLLYGCGFPTLPGGIECRAGGGPPVTHLSGRVTETAAASVSDISGLGSLDLLLDLNGSLP